MLHLANEKKSFAKNVFDPFDAHWYNGSKI